MNINIHVLCAGGLTPLKLAIEKATKEAVEMASSKIPVENVDIVFYASKSQVIESLGFGAHTTTKNLIMIPINIDSKDIEKSLKNNLIETIAHELYHCLRNYSFEGKYTLLESLINEGLSDSFSIEVTGSKPPPWCTALNQKQIKTFLEQAQKEFNSKNYNHYEWFFGSNDKIPKWTGYTLGFNLIREYLSKNPKLKSSTIYNKKAKEFLK